MIVEFLWLVVIVVLVALAQQAYWTNGASRAHAFRPRHHPLSCNRRRRMTLQSCRGRRPCARARARASTRRR